MRHKTVRQKLSHFPLALRALKYLWHEEYHFRFDVIIAGLVLLCAFAFKVSAAELMLLVLSIASVLTAEAVNTAIEELCDHVTLDIHPQIAKVKDLGSAFVLIASTAAVLIGAIIFFPRVLAVLESFVR